MRALPFALALVLLAAPARAQPGDSPGPRGPYAVAGTATPERMLFRDAADPRLVVGYRISDVADVQVGARLGTDDRTFTSRFYRRPAVGVPLLVDEAVARLDQTDRSKAVAAAVGLVLPVGGAEVRARGSLALDRLDRDVVVQRFPENVAPEDRPDYPGAFETEVGAFGGTFAHAGASAVVALPVRRGVGRIAPGLGLARSSTRRLRGDAQTPDARWMAFANVPTTVPLGPTRLTLDATAGIVHAAGDATQRWTHVLEAGLRVDL